MTDLANGDGRTEHRLTCPDCGSYVIHRCGPGDREVAPAGPGSTPQARAAALEQIRATLADTRRKHQESQ